MNVSATEVGRYTQLDQTVDEILIPSLKWFSLQDNILDGSFHPLDSTGSLQIGWWGTQLSAVDGTISSAPTLTIENTRSIHNLRVVGDSLLNEFPVDFTVTLYNGVSVVYVETVTGNASVLWSKQLSIAYDITKIEITVTKVNKAGRTAKLLDGINFYEIYRIDTLSLFSAFPVFSSDNLLVLFSENKDSEVYLESLDTFGIVIDETVQMKNVYTIMEQDERLVYCKVEVLYTDPMLELNVNVAASEQGNYTQLDQLVDGVLVPERKWFVLDHNVLDGTYHPLDSSGVESIGWRSNQIADATGTLAIPPLITITFNARLVSKLQVIGDSLLNLFPVDFIIRVYDALDTLLYTETVVGNTEVSWEKIVSPVSNVVKMTIEISKVNQPYTAARVIEFYTLIIETYDENRLYMVDILEETGYISGSIPLGNISANEVDVVLDNTDRHFDSSNDLSPVANYLKRNRRVRVWFGVEILEDLIEWYLQGIFWTTSWNVPTNMNTVSFTARDRLELMRQTEFITSQLYEDYTIAELFEVIFTDYGLSTSDYYIDPVLDTIVIPYAWFNRMPHREAVQYLAGCNLIQVFCTKLGTIQVLFNPQGTEFVMTTFDEDTNLYDSPTYPLAWQAITNYVEVTANPRVIDVEQEIYADTSIITLTAGQSVTYTYTFTQLPAKDILAPVITADPDIIVDSYVAYAWGMVITFKNNGVITETVTAISISGKPLKTTGTSIAVAKDDLSIQEDGKMKTTVEHDFLQSASAAQDLADTLLAVYNNTEYDVYLNSRGSIALRLVDKIHVNENKRSPEGNYATTRQKISWDGALSAIIEGKKIIE